MVKTVLLSNLTLDAAAAAVLRNLVVQIVARYSFEGSSTCLATYGLAAGTYLFTVQSSGCYAARGGVVRVGSGRANSAQRFVRPLRSERLA